MRVKLFWGKELLGYEDSFRILEESTQEWEDISKDDFAILKRFLHSAKYAKFWDKYRPSSDCEPILVTEGTQLIREILPSIKGVMKHLQEEEKKKAAEKEKKARDRAQKQKEKEEAKEKALLRQLKTKYEKASA